MNTSGEEVGARCALHDDYYEASDPLKRYSPPYTDGTAGLLKFCAESSNPEVCHFAHDRLSRHSALINTSFCRGRRLFSNDAAAFQLDI